MSQNRFSVRHPIQSEKFGDAKSHMSTGLSRTLRIITTNKSLNILLSISKRNKPTIFPNLNAKAADFPVTGEVML